MTWTRSRALAATLVLAVAGLWVAAATAAPDTTPPDTVVTDYDIAYDHASFWFTSPDDPTATFQCTLDAATPVACTSPVAYTGLKATDHTFQVAAVDAAGNVDPTPVTMSWTASAPPPPPVERPANDGFYGAQPISGIAGSVDGTTVNATEEWNEPFTPVRGGTSVWYAWTAPRTGSITFAAPGSAVSIFEGDAPDRVSLWTSGVGSATFDARQNATYRVAVDSVGGSTGTFTLSWAFAGTGAPANDYFADAQTIDGQTGSVTGTTVGATAEPGEPIHSGTSCCDPSNEHSIWYRWTAPVTGTTFFTTEGSAYDTVLRAYTGSSLTGLVPENVYWNDANPWTTWSRVELRVTAGTTYFLAVDAADGSTGAVQLNWRTAAANPSDVTSPTVQPLSPAPGAVVNGTVAFTADASDDVGVDRVVYKVSPNGSGDVWWVGEAYAPPYEVDLDTSVLKPGPYSVFVTSFDAAGNSSTSYSYNITAGAPSSPPTLTVPKSIVREAAGPGGTRIKFSATAQDYQGTALSVSCTPASASLFRLGTTKVTCTAADSFGNRVSKSFAIVVVDTTPPTLDAVPADPVAEATGAKGAGVSFTSPTATDTVSGTLPVTCTPASGSTFALGVTTVTCSATDAAGNVGSVKFTVKVVDTTSPDLTVPADFSVDAVSPAGATVTFAATAVDLVSGDVSPACQPESGTGFAIGDTVVTCTATDVAGNARSASFTVHVKGALEQVADARAVVASLQLAESVATKLDSQLADVAKQLDAARGSRTRRSPSMTPTR
jgi:hypothetical protein